ncbi:hypothetical protein P5673_026947, partial [Acropora cervicornis]
ECLSRMLKGVHKIVMSSNKDSTLSGDQALSSESLLSTDDKGLPCFNPRNDPTNLAVRWKRSLNLYLTAKGVTNDQQRVALLLHTGGAELQELYFTLVDEEEEKSFEACLIDKCFDPIPRRKFLERTNATLKDLQDVARAYKAVEQQMKAIGECSETQYALRQPEQRKHEPAEIKTKSVWRTAHFARDSSCPAQGQNCNKCGAKGHFSACCKAKEKWPAKKDNVNRVSGKTVIPSERNDYAFAVRHKYGSDGEVSLKVGGVRVEGILIDSGASCNLIDYKTWSYLKQNHVVCQSAQSEKKMFAYGQKEPIDVAGTFTTDIVCEANGKRTAEQLDVLRRTVFLRNTKAPGKLTPNFENTPYTVLTKEGNEVMVES